MMNNSVEKVNEFKVSKTMAGKTVGNSKHFRDIYTYNNNTPIVREINV